MPQKRTGAHRAHRLRRSRRLLAAFRGTVRLASGLGAAAVSSSAAPVNP